MVRERWLPPRSPAVQAQGAPAWSLPELLVALAVVMLLAAWSWRGGAEALARQRLQTASQRLVVGLEEARAAALREGKPCGMRLGPQGWQESQSQQLPGCTGVARGLATGVEGERPELQLSHNLPDPVRFSANGLVLDGGTVWLRSEGTALVRCVVVSLPLGVTRLGREGPEGCMPETGP